MAAAWSYDSSNSIWLFTLRSVGASGAGSVTPAKVAADWEQRRQQLSTLGIEGAVVSGQHLAVGVRNVRGDEPRLFAQPALALVTPHGLRMPAAGRFLQPGRPGVPVIEYRLLTDDDLRDALDAGLDLLITRDPGLLDYAAAQADLSSYPLPWSRTYILLQPEGADRLTARVQSDSVRRSLARDAVKAEARPSEPYSDPDPPLCERAAATAARRISPRIVYLQSDAVARSLAERLVGLSGSEPLLSAAGLSDSAFAASLLGASDRAYILAVPRWPVATCSELPPIPLNSSILPLIDTRARAIVRRGSPELTVDWDGIPRISDEIDRVGTP